MHNSTNDHGLDLRVELDSDERRNVGLDGRAARIAARLVGRPRPGRAARMAALDALSSESDESANLTDEQPGRYASSESDESANLTDKQPGRDESANLTDEQQLWLYQALNTASPWPVEEPPDTPQTPPIPPEEDIPLTPPRLPSAMLRSMAMTPSPLPPSLPGPRTYFHIPVADSVPEPVFDSESFFEIAEQPSAPPVDIAEQPGAGASPVDIAEQPGAGPLHFNIAEPDVRRRGICCCSRLQGRRMRNRMVACLRRFDFCCLVRFLCTAATSPLSQPLTRWLLHHH